MNLDRLNYVAWLIDEKDFPAKRDIQAQIQFLTGYGILAPSTHNTQPWLFEIDQDRLKISPNSDYRLPNADPTGRNLFFSLGACALNVMVAAAHFGLSARLRLAGEKPEDGHIILDFDKSKKIDQNLSAFFPQITRRYSEKRLLKGEKISQAILEELHALSDADAEIRFNNKKSDIQTLARLYHQATDSYAADAAFSHELSAWIRGNKTSRLDGMPGFASGLSTPQVFVGKAVMKATPKSLKKLGKKYLKMIQTSSELGIVATPRDTWKDWVRAGLSYERLALAACSHGISLCPMAALVERPERSRLKEFFVGTSGRPQMFFRLIKTDATPVHTPRRSINRWAQERAIVERLKKEGLDISLSYKQLGRHRINYVTVGKGDPLLLIHGANIGWGAWLPNLRELAKHHQVIAVDLPGSGGSTAMDFRKLDFQNDFVASMRDFIKQLKLSRPVAVVGHSFGGAIAIKLARQSDLHIDKLVLVSPMGFTRNVPGKQKLVTFDAFAKLLSKTAMKPTRPNMAKFLAEPLADKGVVASEVVDYYWSAAAENRFNHPLLFMNALTKPVMIRQELLLTKDLKDIKQPTLCIVGDKDPLTPIKKVKTGIQSMQHAQLKVFDKTGHVPSMEKADAFAKAVLDFLA